MPSGAKKNNHRGIQLDDVYHNMSVIEKETLCHVHIVVRRFGDEPRTSMGRITAIATRERGGQRVTVAQVTREAPTSQHQTTEGLLLDVVHQLYARLAEKLLEAPSDATGLFD